MHTIPNTLHWSFMDVVVWLSFLAPRVYVYSPFLCRHFIRPHQPTRGVAQLPSPACVRLFPIHMSSFHLFSSFPPAPTNTLINKFTTMVTLGRFDGNWGWHLPTSSHGLGVVAALG